MRIVAALFLCVTLPVAGDEAFVRVDAALEKLVDDHKVPGLVVAAVRDGRVVAAGAAGIRKAGSIERVTLEDRFHLGSCTKAMTAALAAILVKEGKIEWDTRIGEVFPDVEIHEDYRHATLRNFLSNTSGAPGDVPAALWRELWQAQGPEREQRMLLVRGILGSPAAYPPGEGTTYSNAGFSIAGAMLERRAGRDYDELMRERLFKPLGMDSAGFGPPATPGVVEQPYGHVVRSGEWVAIEPFPHGDNPSAISPAGRVHASILDFAKYANFHLGRMENAPLDRESIAQLHQPVASSGDYALGWVTVKRGWAGGTALMHTGSNTMFYAVAWVAPERNFAAVAACNSGKGAEACDAAVAMMVREFLKD
jgi:CubicO group peptidase (beta-lactamase class C family)